MKTKIEIKSIWGKILFEFEKEDNTIKDTLIEAVKSGADLRGAYLRGADLRGAYLRGVDFEGAYFRGAYLEGAYLRGAYLRGADFEGAYLEGAYLRGADFEGAYLRGAYLRDADFEGEYLRGAYLEGAYLRDIKIRKLFLSNMLYTYTAGAIISEDNKHYIILGCYCRLIEDWENDFWNNTKEFPNDDSEKSQNRLRAYNVCKAWIENYKNLKL